MQSMTRLFFRTPSFSSLPTFPRDILYSETQVHFSKDMQATWLIVFAIASHSDGNGANSLRAISITPLLICFLAASRSLTKRQSPEEENVKIGDGTCNSYGVSLLPI